MAMDHPHTPPATDPHRQLRLISIFAFFPALALLLPCGVISNREWPVVGIAPMFCSSLFQLITIGSRPRLPKTTIFINISLAVFLLGILIPSWIWMAKGNLTWYIGDALNLLAAYGTMPMIVNLMIHIYIAFHGWLQILRSQWEHSYCCCQKPNGCVRLEENGGFAAGGIDGDDDGMAGQPILNFYDETTRPSSEFMTSGCNTPRMSEETLGSEGGQLV